jgi:predicted dehydrogenase
MPVSHCEMAVAALDRGAHVLCEKPLALNSSQAETMASAAQRAGRFVTVGFNMRYMPAAQTLKQVAEQQGVPVAQVSGAPGNQLHSTFWPQSVADQIADVAAAAREGRAAGQDTRGASGSEAY